MICVLLAAPLSAIAARFGPAEYFALMVLGLVGAVVIADTPDKSDPAIGAGKPTNEAEATSVADAAEPVEQRAGAEGNASEQSAHRTLGRGSLSQALERVRQAASSLRRHHQGGSRMP
jgi:hypothetical protein